LRDQRCRRAERERKSLFFFSYRFARQEMQTSGAREKEDEAKRVDKVFFLVANETGETG
jgi:hypothetical protein